MCFFLEFFQFFSVLSWFWLFCCMQDPLATVCGHLIYNFSFPILFDFFYFFCFIFFFSYFLRLCLIRVNWHICFENKKKQLVCNYNTFSLNTRNEYTYTYKKKQEYTEEFRDIAKGNKSKEALPAAPITLIHQRPVGEELPVCMPFVLIHAFICLHFCSFYFMWYEYCF